MLVRVERHPNGPRVWVLGHRFHHHTSGAILMLIGALRHDRTLMVLGVVLIADDWHDVRLMFQPDAPIIVPLSVFNPEIGVITSDDGGNW